MSARAFPLTVLIAETGSETGCAIARVLAEEGHRLILVGRDRNLLLRLKSALDDSDRHVVMVGDLLDDEQRSALVTACEHLPGGVDVLINNAGSTCCATLDDTDVMEISAILDANLRLPIALIRDLLPSLHLSEFGTVINIGSVYGYIGCPGFSVYGASQFGLHGFTEALRRELRDTGIAVHYLATTTAGCGSRTMNSLSRTPHHFPDPPQQLAQQVSRMLAGSRGGLRALGWGECVLIKLNALFPSLVDRALRRSSP